MYSHGPATGEAVQKHRRASRPALYPRARYLRAPNQDDALSADHHQGFHVDDILTRLYYTT
jgi:hypothetical protein